MQGLGACNNAKPALDVLGCSSSNSVVRSPCSSGGGGGGAPSSTAAAVTPSTTATAAAAAARSLSSSTAAAAAAFHAYDREHESEYAAQHQHSAQRTAMRDFTLLLRALRGGGGGHSGGGTWRPERLALALAAPVPRWPRGPPARFRYWVDYQALSSPESALLAEQALQALGGVRTGGPPKLPPAEAAQRRIREYGYMHMGAWDLLLSITAKAMLAAELLRAGQLVSVVPGCLAVSRKTSLVRSLVDAYGRGAAFEVVPLTFKLPDELDAWAAFMRAARRRGDDDSFWMLKNNKQRGTGLRLVAGRDALGACFETTTRPGLEGLRLYRWYLAQRYIGDPLLVNGGRKFGLRLWALVPGAAPLRAYLHERGLALFATEQYRAGDAAAWSGGGAGEGSPGAPPGHVTNYAQNEDGDVWDLGQLEACLGKGAWRRVRSACARAAALVFASALRRMQEVQAQMDLPPRSTFQYFGFDFLLDSSLRPWLMEVNATPSMKVAHSDPSTRARIYEAKRPVVADMFALLGVGPARFDPDNSAGEGCGGGGGGRAGASHADSLDAVKAELRRRGGFAPLMHLFPTEADTPGCSVPWTAADAALRAWAAGSAEYAEAAAALQ